VIEQIGISQDPAACLSIPVASQASSPSGRDVAENRWPSRRYSTYVRILLQILAIGLLSRPQACAPGPRYRAEWTRRAGFAMTGWIKLRDFAALMVASQRKSNNFNGIY
jgi:hypothetical protein